MNNGKITIARNEAILGKYDRDQAADMLDAGHLLPSDHYYDESRAEWVLLSGLSGLSTPPLPPPPPKNSASRVSSPPEFKPTSAQQASDDPKKKSPTRGKGRSKSRAKMGAISALAGWIACLFALGVAAGIWAWAENLNTNLKIADEKFRELEEKMEVLKREKLLLTEITPRGRVRGLITYELTRSRVAIMSSATVGLYRRADVEKALATALQSGEIADGGGFDAIVERLKMSIGTPLKISLTDSNGRMDIPLPEPGQYVLVASAAKSNNGETDRYFWLIGFLDRGQPSSVILLNESNAITKGKPQFVITDVQTMRAGVERTETRP